MMVLFSLNYKEKQTIRQSSAIDSGHSDRQWHVGPRHASKCLHQGAWRLFLGTCGERFTVSAIVGKTVQCTWPSRENPRLSRGKNVNVVSVVAVARLKAVSSIEISTATRNFERRSF